MSEHAGRTAVLILGLGNSMVGDDGFGPAVVEALADAGPPPSVALAVVPDVLHTNRWWRSQPSVWLVDAVIRGAPAGTIHRLDHDAVLSLDDGSRSAHRLGLGDSLRWLLHATPAMRDVRFRLWGAEPLDLTPGAVHLSREVAESVESVVVEILREAVDSGALPIARRPARG